MQIAKTLFCFHCEPFFEKFEKMAWSFKALNLIVLSWLRFAYKGDLMRFILTNQRFLEKEA